MKPRRITFLLKAVIFDVDGTLVDTNALHVAAWQDAFRHFGKEVAREALQAQMGKGGDQLMPVFWSDEELRRIGDDLQRLRVEIFMGNYLPCARPFSGVRALFERLKTDGRRIALASSAKDPELQHHLKVLGIEELVDAATSADSAAHSKPCPDIFQAALGRLAGISVREAIVVGDSPYDALAASRAGMRAIGLLCGGFSRTDLLNAGALAVYRDISELLQRYECSPLAEEKEWI